jgi:hypothetical protein
LNIVHSNKRRLEEEGVDKVVWESGAYGVIRALKKGSRVQEIQKELVRLQFMLQQLGIKLEGKWCCRNKGEQELEQKLANSTDEWGLDRQQLAKLLAELKFKPQVDCMAASYNAVCIRFLARGQKTGAEGVDFMVQKLERGVQYFCCPPVKQIIRAATHLMRSKGISSVLVVPAWESAPYWAWLKRTKNSSAQ